MIKNKTVKILILTGIFPPDIGGPATQLDALIKELFKHGYQIRVLTFGKKDKKHPYPVKVVCDKWPSCLKGFLYLIKGLILGLRSDIIYNQDLYTSGITALIIKKVLKKKLVTRFVEDPTFETGSFSKIRKSILFNSDKIIVVSNYIKKIALEIGLSEKKIKVIYNSIDFLKLKSNHNKEELKKKLGLNEIILLTIARLTPFKGIDMLIEIMPRIIEKYKKISLVIVGSGNELKNLQRIVKSLKLDEYVFFKGRLGRQETINYLKTSDLFLLNTHHEGMSHTLLEAMKIGVPIITTKVGGNPETIKNKETGILIDYRNKEQWINAISQILDNPDLAEKLTKQAKEDLKRFNWDNLVEETIKVFQKL